ncbi:endonuclease domain-containing protein [Longimicrobium terrae]|uniref:Very-short-patch-repair endonuclease n=1 Tax=Longimicrobium terrae TaxID=1639882 RepID=A0A841GV97_9BACT|nr:endonuclease domain-containing protein [Longimicrobium terrae]MBB4635164.1 very-short-patch-repair endonuclease [Longimicrobium terrae]MBB6069558.1 very-short-patch-repair endonuclease [Longimicrobium terrae]NNC31639.1 endonuclease domain-containing protein [Longimicrobium terrae]
MRQRIRGTTQGIDAAARRLRADATSAEEALWGALRKNQIADLRFRRQHPVGRFVLDFYCPALHLAIEVDGDVHEQLVERDSERTRALEAHNYRVVRFRNDEVLTDLPAVVRKITALAESMSNARQP